MEEYLHYVGGKVGVAAITSAAAATAIYMATSPVPLSPAVDLNNQSYEVPNSDGARQSKLAPSGGVTGYLYEDAKTLHEAMNRGLRVSKNGPCLGYKVSKSEYAWITYKEVIERARNLASGFVELGMAPGQSSYIGIYAQNCAEWILTEHACYNQSAVTIPLYDTLGPHACSYIINEAEIKIVVCDKEQKVLALLEKAKETPSLKHIIVVNNLSKETMESAKQKNIQLTTLKEIEESGKKNPVPVLLPKPSDIATVCYTSGTTGNPKGVLLSHANIMINAYAVIMQFGRYGIKCSDVMFSFLPLAHMWERMTHAQIYTEGASVGFYGGDILTLLEDMKALKPTVMPLVPRLFNRIYDKVMAEAGRSLSKKLILNLALHMKGYEIPKLIVRNNGIWDRLVFKKIRDEMGGRVRFIASGSAPLAGHVLNFFRCALGCVIVEGYGQTECVAPCTVSFPGDYCVEHVGPPLPCCHIKLVDVPEMDYFSKEGNGEICVKGPNVFVGYFKAPEKTAETIDQDGWLHTGDIGTWLPNGTLKIVDRKKNIFKLSQGEYVVPEKIENIYLSSRFISQIFVHGESLQSCLIAVAVPDRDVLEPWCKEAGIGGTWEDKCRNQVVKEIIIQDITRLGKQAGLKSFEQIKNIHVYPELFSIGNGLLTPTLKTKRLDCKKRFSSVISDLYREIE